MSVASGTIVDRPLRVALLGLGTVGAAVAARLLHDKWRTDVAERGIRPPELVAVAVRDPRRARSIDLPRSVELSGDAGALLERGDLDVVVELLGGIEPAGDLVERSLAAGRAVVTANKALLAERGQALELLARRSAAPLRFEAAVAGGIPILASLADDLAANRIEQVRGIVNGTTNYILTAMSSEGRAYDDVLADAQARGYAEADPSGDVEGRDAAHKLVLLARLAFRAWLEPGTIGGRPATPEGEGKPGITGVTAAEIRGASECGLALKLVAFAGRSSSDAGTSLEAWVEPCAVSRSSAIGSTDGVLNAVEVVGQPLGRLTMRGRGAGGDPTSSAVLADLLALVRGAGSTWGALPEAAAAARPTSGRERPNRWFYLTAETPVLTEPMRLDGLRASLRAEGVAPQTVYRLLEDD